MATSLKHIWKFVFIIAMVTACQSEEVSFNEHIKPLLNKKCVSCHGGVKKAGGLSLLYRDAALVKNEKSGKAAIVPGSAKNSEIYKRVVSDDPEYMMPRSLEHTLEPKEVELLKKWIDNGANWDTHWAYNPVEKISIPTVDDDWANTTIDKLVLAQLQKNNVAPNDPANQADLLRRISLDVTGVPVFEKISDTSYTAAIDQLLASPAFGEHWASMWLDLARYADSHGYEKDTHRNIWRYRDWVIKAFNKDMSFDEFTKLQMAGDLIDPNDYDHLIATSFHRNTMTNMEGGTDDEEFRVAAVIDRLNTTFEIWQSTPIGCAQCHDHPYDPISQVEFYETMSLFDNTIDADLMSDLPMLETYSTASQEKIDSIIQFIATVEEKVIDPNILDSQKIKAALYPTLLTMDCDDFENVLIYSNGIISNWTINVNDMIGRQFYFMYEDVDFDGLDSIQITYSTKGEISFLEGRLDTKDGQLLFNTGFTKTESSSGHEWVGDQEWNLQTVALPKGISGKHHLIFEIQNPQEIVPDGILLFKQIDLIYEDSNPTDKIINAKNELIALRSKADKTPILRQKLNPLKRTSQLFVRGNHAVRADTVNENIPQVLNVGNDDINNRLEFAEWLVDKENPLTARVMVNRIWERIFGIGIVETLEDFGSMGELPSNQALLDYLAHQFMYEHKWSIKSLIKEILLSNTYQQSSYASAEKLTLDPYNQLFSRGPRMRLSAEQIRDQVLYVSELLQDTIGGKSVMPPQPKDVWQTPYNNQKWEESEGKHKYRRGLYTYWKRSSPYPSMEAFDSPSREFCKSRRIKTNTPTQALVTLNDPVYLEAANALGNLMQTYSKSPEEQIQYAFKKSLGKECSDNVKAALQKLYTQAQSDLSAAENETTALTSPSAVVAHAIFNLDGFLNKT